MFKKILFILIFAAFSGVGIKAQNISANKTDYDNTVTEPIKQFNIKEIYETLTRELELSKKQQEKLKTILADYDEKYKKLLVQYNKKSEKLTADREKLFEIRNEIDKKSNLVPFIVRPHLNGLQIYKYDKIALEKYPYLKDLGYPPEPEKRTIPAEHPQRRKVAEDKQP